MNELVLPNDTNILGNILGGKVMHYMDVCAAMSAYKHARTPVVTASVDNLDFLAPAKMGDIICMKSSVNYTGWASMEIGVRIESENPITGKIIPNSTMETLKQINHNYFNNLVEIEKDDKTNEIQKNKCILKKKDLKKTSTIN